MSEEEKALETLKEVASDDFDTLGDDISPKMAQNILNVIDKQQKEIEELKQNRDEYKEEYKKLLNARYYDYISKYKIREKIEELESLSKNITMQPSIYNYEIDLLEELLEEN